VVRPTGELAVLVRIECHLIVQARPIPRRAKPRTCLFSFFRLLQAEKNRATKRARLFGPTVLNAAERKR
jgi:hypothetical protein